MTDSLREHLEAMTPQLEVLMDLSSGHPARIAIAEIAGRQAAALDELDNAQIINMRAMGKPGERGPWIQHRRIEDPRPDQVPDPVAAATPESCLAPDDSCTCQSCYPGWGSSPPSGT